MTTDVNAGTTTTSNDGGESQAAEGNADNGGQATSQQTQGEAQGQNQGTEQQGGNKDDASTQVPETYEFQMPEGVELDKAAAEEFSTVAKDLKLTQEQAQLVANVGAKMVQRQAEAHVQQVQQWVDQVKADKEIGGDKFDENIGIARSALDQFGSPELKALLESTGFGNHPELVKFAHRVGKAISDGRFVSGKASGQPNDPAKKLFPEMN